MIVFVRQRMQSTSIKTYHGTKRLHCRQVDGGQCCLGVSQTGSRWEGGEKDEDGLEVMLAQ